MNPYKPIPQRDPEVLKGAARDFLYLVDQASAIFYWNKHLKQRLKSQGNEIEAITNSIVESSLLSIRVMNEFFQTGGRGDDIRSEQFPGFSGAAFLTTEEESAIHKHLAHMTVLRAANPNPPWSKKMFSRAFVAAESFLSYLASKPEFQPAFDIPSRLNNCRVLRAQIDAGKY